MDRIYLIGYMGSGKSTLGLALAKALNREFIDLDNLIQSRSDKSIPQLFYQYGEEIFREVEASALHKTFLMSKIVVGTGGGAPCFYSNMDEMNRHGMTIYLKIAPDLIVDRIIKDQNVRPLLANKSKDELILYIQNHMNLRKQYYERATLIINADQKVPDLVANILQAIKTNE